VSRFSAAALGDDQGEQILLATMMDGSDTRLTGHPPNPSDDHQFLIILPDNGIDDEQPVECGQPLGREAVQKGRFHPLAGNRSSGPADAIECVGNRQQRMALPEGADDRLGDRLALVGRGGLW
jgi:hypothetical protein